jgi:MFS family permease
MDSSDTLAAGGRLGACVGAVALVSLLAFESMAVAAVMPAIAADLDGLHAYALAFGSTVATSMLGMVLAAQWSDSGRLLRSTVAGLAAFAIGLLLAGCARSMTLLVFGRIAQGLGSGLLEVALFVGMGRLVPAPLHPRLFALFSAAWMVPGLVGPFVATTLVAHLGWRSVFLLASAATPFAAVLLLPAFRRMTAPPPDAAKSRQPSRLPAAALAMAGTLCLQGAAVDGRTWHTLAMLAIGVAAALGSSRRLLPKGTLLLRRGLPAVIGLRALLAGAFGSAEVFIPLYLTREKGWSLGQAGMALSVGAVLWSVGSGVQSRIDSKRARQHLLRAGFVAVAVGIAAVVIPMVLPMPASICLAGWALAGFGIGLASPMMSVLTLDFSSSENQGRHAAALQFGRAFGTSVALALAGVLFALSPSSNLGFILVLVSGSTLAAVGGSLIERVAAVPDRPPAAGASTPGDVADVVDLA